MEEYIRLLDLPDEFDFAILKKAYRKKVKIFHPDKAKNDSERVEFEAKMKLLNEANEYLKEYLERHNGKYTKSIENDTTDYSQDNNESYTEETSQEKYEEEHNEEEAQEEPEYEEYEETEDDNETSGLSLKEKIQYAIKLLLNPKLLEEEMQKSETNPFAPIFQSPKNTIIFFTLIILLLYPIYEYIDKVMYPDTPKNTQQEVVKESVQEPIQKAQTEVNKDFLEDKKDVVLDDTTEIGRYMGNIQQRIKRNWDIPKNYMAENGVNEVSVEVGFTLYKDGNIIGKPKIIRTSGLDIVDKRCLEAVELSAPFNPIPSELNKDTLEMTFTFEADRK